MKIVILLIVLQLLSTNILVYADVWTDAARNIQTLDPSEVKDLPEQFREQLKLDSCRIPTGKIIFGEYKGSLDTLEKPWIKCSFAQKGQIDYAAVCEKNGKTQIKLYWGGTKSCIGNLGKEISNTGLIEGGESSSKGKFFYFTRDLACKRSKNGTDVLIENREKGGSTTHTCLNRKWESAEAGYGE